MRYILTLANEVNIDHIVYECISWILWERVAGGCDCELGAEKAVFSAESVRVFGPSGTLRNESTRLRLHCVDMKQRDAEYRWTHSVTWNPNRPKSRIPDNKDFKTSSSVPESLCSVPSVSQTWLPARKAFLICDCVEYWGIILIKMSVLKVFGPKASHLVWSSCMCIFCTINICI